MMNVRSQPNYFLRLRSITVLSVGVANEACAYAMQQNSSIESPAERQWQSIS